MKKTGFIILILMFLIFFLLHPADVISASRQGLILWFEQILPALLPFTILSYVVMNSGLLHINHAKSTRSGKITKCEWYVILCGFLFGFPIGSKLAADLYQEKMISRQNASILCCFCNNLSPVYVLSVMSGILHLPIDWKFLFLLYGIPFFTGIFLLMKYGKDSNLQKKKTPRFHLDMQIIDAGIINGFEVLIKICGYIIIFSVLAEVIRKIPVLPAFGKLCFIGCTEITNGISELSVYSCSRQLKCLLAVLFLSLNGLSGFFQTASVLNSSGLSVSRYLIIKILLTGLTVLSATILFILGILV